jgi:LmbE family N-acetylglucosaminyl deacetylase
MNVLCVMAHQDDETLACGGTLAKHAAAGDAVSVMTFTDGVGSRGDKADPIRRQREWFAALRALGLHATEDDPGASVLWCAGADGSGWMRERYQDQQLDVVPMLMLAKYVAYGCEKFRPDVIYTHWPSDLNQDHRRVAEAVLIATRLVTGSTVRRVLACEVPESTSQAFGLGQPFAPTVFVALSAEAVERKLAALACYRSEQREPPHLRSEDRVSSRMSQWGAVAGVGDAEAFVLLREVVQ